MILILMWAGWLTAVAALATFMTGRLPQHQSAGISAIGCGLCGLSYALAGAPLGMSVNAGLSAYLGHAWWNGGGGGGTKRRLRSLARRFTPVRRTAPAAAS